MQKKRLIFYFASFVMSFLFHSTASASCSALASQLLVATSQVAKFPQGARTPLVVQNWQNLANLPENEFKEKLNQLFSRGLKPAQADLMVRRYLALVKTNNKIGTVNKELDLGAMLVQAKQNLEWMRAQIETLISNRLNAEMLPRRKEFLIATDSLLEANSMTLGQYQASSAMYVLVTGDQGKFFEGEFEGTYSVLLRILYENPVLVWPSPNVIGTRTLGQSVASGWAYAGLLPAGKPMIYDGATYLGPVAPTSYFSHDLTSHIPSLMGRFRASVEPWLEAEQISRVPVNRTPHRDLIIESLRHFEYNSQIVERLFSAIDLVAGDSSEVLTEIRRKRMLMYPFLTFWEGYRVFPRGQGDFRWSKDGNQILKNILERISSNKELGHEFKSPTDGTIPPHYEQDLREEIRAILEFIENQKVVIL